ncbi:hypothetical protein KA005_70700, partial [bacterium]|nr:hypothetical protein [bacterium]
MTVIEKEKIQMPRKPPPPNDLERLVAKGLEFFAENNFKMALKYIDDALELDPKDQTAIFTKGRILMKSGKYKEGTKYYNKLVDLGRESLKNAQRYTPEAELYENYGQPEPDEGLNYSSGGAIDSGSLEDNLKANALNLKNIDEPDEDLNYEKVITLCDELLCKEPDNIEALINKSMALGLNAQYELAINCCNQILDLESNNCKSLKNKAF